MTGPGKSFQVAASSSGGSKQCFSNIEWHYCIYSRGETAAHTTSQLLALDLVNIQAGWNKLADIPQPVSHTVVTAIPGKTGDKIFLCGGRKKNNSGISDFYNSVFVYDVITNTWEEKRHCPMR